jgi:AcrR family transcriptional regulator
VAGSGSRDAVLAAATRLVTRRGAEALTLEAAAREAGVSKGGLLYHFPSKLTLLRAMVEAHLDRLEGEVARRHADDWGPGGWVQAFAQAGTEAADGSSRGAATLLAAFAVDPTLLEAARARYAAWQRRLVEDGVDPARATVVRLAADGLAFAELLGLAPPDGELRRRVLEELAALAQTPDGAVGRPMGTPPDLP